MFRKKLYYSVLISAVFLTFEPVFAAEIHVSTWAELKSAVENGIDGAGAGGTVYLDKNIDVPDDFNSTITTAVPGIVIDGQGNTITTITGSGREAFNFSSSAQTDLQIKNVIFENMGGSYIHALPINNSGTLDYINADFINNYAKTHYGANGGAITNNGKGIIKKIEGNFTGNKAVGISGNSGQGGAIHNKGSISNITGDFSGNYARADNGDAFGGAIYNNGTMTLTNSSFYDNYAQSDRKTAQGGAIYNAGNMTITADNGVSEFSGNKVIHNDADGNKVEDSEAIYNIGNLTLNAINNGVIRFDDKINGISLEEYASNDGRYDIVSDNAGGYYAYDGEDLKGHIILTDSGYMVRDYSYIIPEDEVAAGLKKLENQGAHITQQGDDYHIVMDGQEIDFIKVEDGYVRQASVPAAGITITGDDSGRVVFNNEVTSMGGINVSGTNVDVNAGTFDHSLTSSGGVVNINADAGAANSRILSGGTMNVADGAKVLRTEVGTGGMMNVASGGYAEDTTINDGGKLTAAAGAMLHNMLAGGGAELDIDMHSLLTGNIIIDAAAIMGGT